MHQKYSQLIPEQMLSETVYIYKDALPYIICQLKSTIQHEAAHRKDEEQRNESIVREKQPMTAQVIPFSNFTNKSRAEPIAEREEEDCDVLLPPQMGAETTTVNINQLFEHAKSSANINIRYKRDIHAGHLPPDAQGMYLMQDLSGRSMDDLVRIKNNNGTSYTDYDNRLWIDVRKLVEPFMTEEPVEKTQPATYQGPGDGAVQADLPGVSRQTPQGVQSVPTVPSVPAVGGWQAMSKNRALWIRLAHLANMAYDITNNKIIDKHDVDQLNIELNAALRYLRNSKRYFERLTSTTP